MFYNQYSPQMQQEQVNLSNEPIPEHQEQSEIVPDSGEKA